MSGLFDAREARATWRWLGPMLVLAGLGLGAGLVLALASGGREVGDDAPLLVLLSRHPLALFGDYGAVGLGPNFASYPPLLPLAFGSGVRPFLPVASEFWAIRVGSLLWSGALLLLVLAVAARARANASETRYALWLFALLPSVWGAVGLIPQEEAYVASFAVGIYLAAGAGGVAWAAAALALAVLAGKYFLLVLAFPVAFAAERPLRALVILVVPSLALLGAWVAYHALAFDHPVPILSHTTGVGSMTAWALADRLGLGLPPEVVRPVSVAATGACVFWFSVVARRRGFGLVPSFAGALWVALLTLYLSLPAYVLWALPFTVVCVSQMTRGRRWIAASLLFAWGAAEWGGNLFRGVALALETERAEGKLQIAALAERVFGAGFPFEPAYLALVVLALVSGLTILRLVVLEATHTSGSRAHASGART